MRTLRAAAALVAVTLLDCEVEAASAAGIGRVVVIRQHVDANGRSAIDFKSTLAASVAAGLDTDTFARPLAVPPGFTGLSLPSIPSTATSAAALTRATKAVADQAGGVAGLVAQYLRSRGDSAAWYTLEQTAKIRGRDRILTWVAYLDQQERAIFGAPQFFDTHPVILYVRYVPGSTRTGLPLTWRYTGAGKIAWSARASDDPGAGTTWNEIDVEGAYDAPGPGSADPEAGLRCLLDRRGAQCRTDLPDVRTLFDKVGATAAIVDYVRSIRPEYRDDTTHGRVAVAAMDVYSRSLHRAPCGTGCDAIFSNRYRIGYRLALESDRLLVQPDNSWAPLARYTLHAVSPIQDTVRKVALTSAQTATLGGKMIRPDTGEFVDVSSMPAGMVVNLAAVTTD